MNDAHALLREWLLSRLVPVSDSPRVVVRDALGLLPRADGGLHAFARTHGYTVIVAATNLAFRELYEQAVAATETGKLLVVDRAPPGPSTAMPGKAPPPFYPDLLAQTPP